MQAANSNPTRIARDQYGALSTASIITPEQQQQLNGLRDAAVKVGKLPEPYIRSSNKELKCLNLDIYDVLSFRGKAKGLIVQARRRSVWPGTTSSVLLASRKLPSCKQNGAWRGFTLLNVNV